MQPTGHPGRKRIVRARHLTGPRSVVVLCVLALFFSIGWPLSLSAAEETSTNAPATEPDSTLTLANRRICVFRATLDGYSPEERAAAASARLESVLAQAKTILVSTQAVPTGIKIQLDGKDLFVITPGDVLNVRGQTLESKAAGVAEALRNALHELHSLSTPREVVLAIGKAVFGFALFAALFWAAKRTRSWFMATITRIVSRKTEDIKLRDFRTVGLKSFVTVERAVLNFVTYLFIAFFVYALLWYELRCFPYSRPWGDFLRSHCISALAALGRGVLNGIPELLVVILIVLAARMFSQVISRVFAAAEKGEIRTSLFDPLTAATTRRILVLLVWVIAVVVAYPYIPGSESLAFKGVTVFAGVVVSLGSSNIFNQMASGLLLIYSRTLRVGDYVRVGELEGTVLTIGLCVTRIRTIKNEEVQLANSVLLGTATTNYSRLGEIDGLFTSVKVTIGYATPWRQVHAMLLQAASRTTGLKSPPQPFVLQTALSDFYVEYELNALIEKPERRVWVQSDLNNNIQDIFNEHGVQIMSPHYLADPPKPHIVPKSDWFRPPAKTDQDVASAFQDRTAANTTSGDAGL